jgi:hypothetical protein
MRLRKNNGHKHIKTQVELLRENRGTWVINPASRIVTSKKIYDRQRIKKETREESRI